MFLRSLSQQCTRHKLQAELILVEWNPPEDRPPLKEALFWPEANGWLEARIITVPQEIHNEYKYGDGYPLYQMIAKNVGIRRARGEYILSTNVDILFSEDLIAWMASGQMRRGYQYRVDRYDVDMPVPDPETIESIQLLKSCKNNLLRINERNGTTNLRTGKKKGIFTAKAKIERDRLHTNGCGDFAMAHRDHWYDTCAYPELDLFSFHIDSLWCYVAHFSGVREQYLEPPLATYHLEHTEGYTPESLKKMYTSLEKKKVPRLTVFQTNSLAFRMSLTRRPVRFNTNHWGLPERRLNEEICVPAHWTDGVETVSSAIEQRESASKHGRINSAFFSEKKKPVPGYQTQSSPEQPTVSAVVIARNDNHGDNMLERIQTFLDGWREMAEIEQLKSEIVFVEWNPPPDKKSLSEVLRWRTNSWSELRFITVPPEMHNILPNADRIPLYQMIGKNVGIRRSKGEFILATNIDLLFNQPMFRFLANAKLDKNAFFRTARLDCGKTIIPANLNVLEKIEFCENNLVRLNLNNKTMELEGKKMMPASEIWKEPLDNWIPSVIKRGENRNLFSNACGDFTMLHRDAWDKLRGYPEIPIWSIFLDGLLLHAAIGAGLHQVELSDPLRMYHIEHGGAWAVDHSKDKSDVKLDYKTQYKPWCRSLLAGTATHVNPCDWGWAHVNLPEQIIADTTVRNHGTETKAEAL